MRANDEIDCSSDDDNVFFNSDDEDTISAIFGSKQSFWVQKVNNIFEFENVVDFLNLRNQKQRFTIVAEM